ncbi:MAG TPA: hypothetical protein VGN88_05960 [Phycisphaerae bacterium]
MADVFQMMHLTYGALYLVKNLKRPQEKPAAIAETLKDKRTAHLIVTL